METGFFPPDPPVTASPAEPPHERRPWFEPPEDEVPALFAVSEVIARGDDVVVALTGARVYSDGVELLVDRHLRRGTRDEREWRSAHADFDGYRGGRAVEPNRLRWGLVLGDGRRVIAEDRFASAQDAGEVGPTLRMNGGSGGGGSHRYTMHNQLWLHPLPPEGPLELVVQWPAFGIGESRTVLDGGQLAALAPSVKPLWG